MITLTRRTPSNTAYAFQRDPFFRLVDTFFRPAEEAADRSWTPRVNIQETQESYRLEAELPGLTKEDVQITLENNVLRLAGERKLDEETKSSYQRIERVYGSFSRSFALPMQVDTEKVEASFQNGILTITVPKAEQAKPRTISIN
jgi:HSP20 family protein